MHSSVYSELQNPFAKPKNRVKWSCRNVVKIHEWNKFQRNLFQEPQCAHSYLLPQVTGLQGVNFTQNVSIVYWMGSPQFTRGLPFWEPLLSSARILFKHVADMSPFVVCEVA